jgi:hypothetical protein
MGHDEYHDEDGEENGRLQVDWDRAVYILEQHGSGPYEDGTRCGSGSPEAPQPGSFVDTYGLRNSYTVQQLRDWLGY